MESWQYVVALIDALDKCNVPYMVVGSLSASVYGLTRSTKDADFVLELGDRPITDLLKHLGPEFHLDRQLAFETNTLTMRQRILVGENGFLIELFRLSSDPHDQERFRRRALRQVPLLIRAVYVPTAEDVIITKTRWALTAQRQKDKSDVVTVIAVQKTKLDWSYIEQWCKQHGTLELVQEMRAEAEAI